MASLRRSFLVSVVLVVLIFYLKCEVSYALKNSSISQTHKNKNKTHHKSYKEPNSTNSSQNETLSNATSKDSIFESSGILDVEFGSSSGDSGSGESDETAEIRLNGKRLHSISEAIAKLLNSGRESLKELKKGTAYNPRKSNGPVVRAYVSDSKYDNPRKIYRKSSFFPHRYHPHHFRHRPHLLRHTPFIPYEIPYVEPEEGLQYNEDSVVPYRRPMYLYYPNVEPMRYNSLSSPNSPYAENEQNLLSNYAFQQQLERIQFYSCHPNPCKHGGHCHRVGLRVKCLCKMGFTGARCQVRRRYKCHPNPCLNGGSCSEVEDGFDCTCQKGYKGITCREEIKCRHDTCHNGGTCTEFDNGFQCTCALGFKGVTCREQTPCDSNPCRNGGTCLPSEDGGFSCLCRTGWSCHDCGCHAVPQSEIGVAEKRGDSCHPNPCSNSGTCYSTETGYTCYCAAGFRGETCQVPEYCSADPCLNDGTCKEKPGGYHCICQPQFRGRRCEKENHCKPSNPCENNGMCIETEDGYKCHCKIGYQGFNCEERQFCKPNPCKSGGICLPDEDTYMCTCPMGYKGKNCESRDLCFSNPCFHKGTCIDVENTSYKCLCPKEWIGHQCEARNPCYPNPCSHNAHCVVIDGHFECRCSVGFKGEKCRVRDLCRPNPCRNEGTCIQRGPDYYECECKRGYKGDTCEGIDACLSNPCLFGGTCMEQGDEFQCVCEVTRTGQTCEVVNPCYPDPCHNDGLCMGIHEGEPHCQCAVGYVGSLCDARDPCLINPCSNDGTCVNIGRSYQCNCKADYIGKHCEIRSKCLPNPCQNDGTCRDVSTGRGFVCYCSIAYLGANCEKLNLCHPHNPCKNGGTCKSDGNILGCQCKLGYLGSHCDQVNFCYGNPCNNGGTCTPKLDGFECDCREGFYGRTCDAQSSACLPSPCKNGGLCSEVKNKDGFICICKEGFIGKTCERHDACSPSPCLHNGTCLQAQNKRGYHCLCHKGWHGYYCQRIDRCFPIPCLNGGSCFNVDEGYVCQCRPRFNGPNCGIDKCMRCDPNALCIKGTCECKPGFIGNGFTCTASGNPCSPNPCDNNGICTPGHGGKVFLCRCPAGFTGEKCEISMSACKARPCLNGGQCVDATNNNGTLLDGVLFTNSADYRCVCPKGYAGPNCGKLVLVNPCNGHPCVNGGTCFDDTNNEGMDLKLINALDYRCFCPAAYSGKNCQVSQPACQSSPCLNGGTCLDGSNTADVAYNANGYKCLCPTGYTGNDCEVGLKVHSEVSLVNHEGSQTIRLANAGVQVTETENPLKAYVTDNTDNALPKQAGVTFKLATKPLVTKNPLSKPVGIKVSTQPSPPVVLIQSKTPGVSETAAGLLSAPPAMVTYQPDFPPSSSPVGPPAIIMPPGAQPPDSGTTREVVPMATTGKSAQILQDSLKNILKMKWYNSGYPYTNYPTQAPYNLYGPSPSQGSGINSVTGRTRGNSPATAYSSSASNGYNEVKSGSQSWYPYGQGYNSAQGYQNTGYSYPWGGRPYSAYIKTSQKDEEKIENRHHRRHFK